MNALPEDTFKIIIATDNHLAYTEKYASLIIFLGIDQCSPIVNYEDLNLIVSILVFTIHGNHNDLRGNKQISVLDILAALSLLNYTLAFAMILITNFVEKQIDETVNVIVEMDSEINKSTAAIQTLCDQRIKETEEGIAETAGLLKDLGRGAHWRNLFHEMGFKKPVSCTLKQRFFIRLWWWV
ncbi:hypothetical protein RN001_013752 [Aquatica leii]|uniref:Uncharacterized protein n=1 Tax=Aquatica leii TaxID=1421715 RepID=A0AAN7P0G6_9COLE|nr:hypothetical protein RN001_013752 [Aquatica leii]